jgi:putative ABC transport system ATP-binding protein
MQKNSACPIIELKDVSKSYRSGEVETVVLKDLSFDIKEGEFVTILGPSGCGKTTLLNLIGGLDTPTRGHVLFNAEDLARKSHRELAHFRHAHIGFIFQFYNLLPTLTASENVELTLELNRSNLKDIRAAAHAALEMVGLANKTKRFPSQLSGGEQQRVAIARALVKNPKVVLADEPTGNLDERTAAQVIDLMLSLHKKTATTFVVVTHNQRIADHADKVIEIHNFHQAIH